MIFTTRNNTIKIKMGKTVLTVPIHCTQLVTPKKFVFRHLNILDKHPQYTDLNIKFDSKLHDKDKFDRKIRYNHSRLMYLTNEIRGV